VQMVRPMFQSIVKLIGRACAHSINWLSNGRFWSSYHRATTSTSSCGEVGAGMMALIVALLLYVSCAFGSVYACWGHLLLGNIGPLLEVYDWHNT